MTLRKSLIAAALAVLGTTACASTQYPPAGQHAADLKPYTITFRNFKAAEVLAFLSSIETGFPGTNYIGEHEGGPRAWRQNLMSSLSSTEMHRAIYGELMRGGLTEDEIRITVREQGQIEVAKLGLRRLSQ
ncbi:hypothetical protein HAD_06035 [Hyphomonas adhaerens MHS-3]|uniref:Lipoprotein n=1 Tax=Hyphomonas adhaerens MHS-3 TaxID=1280949 RepID=A0A069E571_9PROT|nr:hypothetical protein [Hyphomonas adhaerens]KCZ85218.1 hypothetical protein HAD_06035 [Hyphomonas adhaerens MHS-3]